MEKKQYGWFWACPNGGKECHYRHALPPGYILKSQMKSLLDEESEKIAIEDEIENQVMIILILLTLHFHFVLTCCDGNFLYICKYIHCILKYFLSFISSVLYF